MTDSQARILALNCGSSSVKLALLDPTCGRRELTGQVEHVTGADTDHRVLARLVRNGTQTEVPVPGTGHAAAVSALLAELTPAERSGLHGVGHRAVHGADVFRSSTVVDDRVFETLSGLVHLAPLHLPAALAGLQAARTALPDLPHVAVFDTAFHATMPPVAARYAVAREWFADHGVRRYGFHGISHRYVAERLAQRLGRPLRELRLVTLHLGNGCSATAVAGGESVDTSMGFTPLEGLMMGTRSGDVDPAVLPYLSERTGRSAEELVDDLNRRSGLLGVSGVSNDVREVSEAADAGSADAALALDMFCYRAATTVGRLAVAAGGLDVLVFTAGIGENSPRVRRQILARLGHLGLQVDPELNEAGRADPHDPHDADEPRLVSAEGPVTAWVVPTDEERLIAAETAALVA